MDLDELDETCLRLLYESMKNSIIDVASMDAAGVSEMKKFLYQHAKTGDLLRVNVSFDEDQSSKFVTEAIFLADGAEIQDLDTNVFLPFEGIPDAESITISSSKFEFVGDKVVVDGVEVGFGAPFMVGGRRVVLAKGSIVLLLEDSLVRVFPEEGIQGEIVLNEGTLAVGDIMTTGVFQLEEKSVADEPNDPTPDTFISSYVFFHDASTDRRTCVSKRTHAADFMLTAGSSLLDLGYLDGSLENVLSFDSSSMGIRSVSVSGAESVATIDFEGLSFDSNDAAVILGQFRMKYDETSDTVQIQHLDETSGVYVTKREFGR